MIKNVKLELPNENTYPYNVGALKNTKEIVINPKITILVGENGSGKSTLLKAIAYYNNSINVSQNDLNSEYYLDSRMLAGAMKVTYSVKTRKGFFFSGEDFISYINNLKIMKEDLYKHIEELKAEFVGKPAYSLQLALGPLKGQISALENTYGGELGEKSHGEGFLEFFKARMHQQGIYLLDEPETPLSPINQYQLVVLISDLVKEGSQVIIATHSPILMALKDATIYQFNEDSIKEVQYEDIESVSFMKHFLNDKDNYINRI